jgi:hypothetical protein
VTVNVGVNVLVDAAVVWVNVAVAVNSQRQAEPVRLPVESEALLHIVISVVSVPITFAVKVTLPVSPGMIIPRSQVYTEPAEDVGAGTDDRNCIWVLKAKPERSSMIV